jgi:hypothetical protein
MACQIRAMEVRVGPVEAHMREADLEQVDHVRVADVLQNFDLARHAPDVALVDDPLLFVSKGWRAWRAAW